MPDHRLPPLQTPRLTLRTLTDGDVPALYDIFSHPEVVRYWSTPALPDPAAAGQLLREIHDYARSGGLMQWGIARREDGLVIGTCTLAEIDRTHRRAEVGFALGYPYWRKGYARETLVRLLRHAFGEMNLNRLEADVDPRNAASLKTLGQLGFEREGYLRERWRVHGEVQDSVLLGLLAATWRAAQDPNP
ncbi:MAG: GNAT family protein [Catalinimonas sp.]